jgi:subtilisin family serine protease
VVISSIDTGVMFSHSEFLPGQLIAGRDWVNNDLDPSDDNDHGTHTTGTMVGQNVGVAGVSGAGSNVRVLVQKVCGRRGCPSAAIANAIRAAADYTGMVAMNLSLGGSTETKAEKDAILYAVGKNVLVIASAGNGGTGTVSCPACDPLAISVAASNWQDELSYYSNWGPGLDLTAPGGELYSNTSAQSGIYSAVRSGYAYFQGTSMAAPQVTGTAAIVASVTGLRGAALRTRLETTTDDLGASGDDTTYGHGRLNSYRAVTAP